PRPLSSAPPFGRGAQALHPPRAQRALRFDRGGTPAVENQATDRAFRIGQTRRVQVHKLVCAGTFEEQLDELIERKLGLARAIVGTSEAWITEMSTAELRALFALRRRDAEVLTPRAAGRAGRSGQTGRTGTTRGPAARPPGSGRRRGGVGSAPPGGPGAGWPPWNGWWTAGDSPAAAPTPAAGRSPGSTPAPRASTPASRGAAPRRTASPCASGPWPRRRGAPRPTPRPPTRST